MFHYVIGTHALKMVVGQRPWELIQIPNDIGLGLFDHVHVDRIRKALLPGAQIEDLTFSEKPVDGRGSWRHHDELAIANVSTYHGNRIATKLRCTEAHSPT